MHDAFTLTPSLSSLAIAEAAERGFISTDILDFIGTTDPLKELDYVTYYAERSSAVLCLHNMGYLVAKRTANEPERCRQITSEW